MKEWLTAREIAFEALPYIPTTESAVVRLAKREAWDQHPSYSRERSGKGGGIEYHYRVLPSLAQIAYFQKYSIVGEQADDAPAAPVAQVLSDRAKTERDARLAIIAAFEMFSRGLRLNKQARIQLFCDRYETAFIKVDDWVKEKVPSVSRRTLHRWLSARKSGRTDALAVDRSKARAGTGVLDIAENGRVRGHILGLIAHQPHLTAAQIRKLCRAEFGDVLKLVSKGVEKTVPMPPVRTIQHFLKALKEMHKVELLKLTNPDKFRSTMLPSGTGMLAHISQPNELWQIDASPVDALCTDGRHSVYVCIDIATRRFITYVSKTPRAAAVGLLIRKAMLAWGTPRTIKTDNGSDFTANETKRLFTALGIEADLSDAYSPAQKGHVERAIGTYQRAFVQLLPGYIGHSVTDRKAIEDRKSFADRLGQDTAEAFNVSLSGAQLQELSDRWCESDYQHRAHAGLKGETPFNVAARSVETVRIVSERALDVLLMPAAGTNGRRTVTKFGIRIDHNYYRSASFMPGTEVFVRRDPNDIGKIYAFTPDQAEYLGEAICPELSGIHPETFEKARKELNAQLIKERVDPIRAEIAQIVQGPSLIEKSLEVAARDVPNVIVLPKRQEQHSTPQIAAALAAATSETQPVARETHERMSELLAAVEADLAPQPKHDNVRPIRTDATPQQRFRAAREIEKAIAEGVAVEPERAAWFGSYRESAEYKAQKGLWEAFGDQEPVQRT
ncbi:DDE-type integrase/transposase/recombinase [Rhizobium leguminosarum]|uniref:DDE-type integrase/transposase/recombinase n=1 Tax=Rhizobium leguminosarum TaxID=384 RepID=UPI003F9A105E